MNVLNLLRARLRSTAAGVRSEEGFALPEFIALLPIIFLFIYLVALVPLIPERQHVMRAAAAEGARAAILADDAASAGNAAEFTAAEVVTNYGLDPSEFQVSTKGTVGRGQPYTVTVQTQVPPLRLPFGIDAGSFPMSVSVTERFEDFRSFEE